MSQMQTIQVFAEKLIRSEDYKNTQLIDKINQAVSLGSKSAIIEMFFDKGPLTIDIVNKYIMDHYDYLNNVCKNEIPNFKKLMENNWFLLNGSLHKKVILAAQLGIGRHVYTDAGDFEEHLDALIDEYYSNLSDICNDKIEDYNYLESRCWFMKNKNYHDKLITIINNNRGNDVNVLEDDFGSHLDDIIASFSKTN
jgi:hypothetical protein